MERSTDTLLLLRSEDKKIRIKCLEVLENILTDNVVHIQRISYKSELLANLVHIFDDRYEVCQEKALHVVAQLMLIWDENEEYVDIVVPRSIKKLGTDISEEIRLLHLKLLSLMTEKYSQYLSSYVGDVLPVLEMQLLERSPDIKIECFLCLQNLAKDNTEAVFARADSLFPLLMKNAKCNQYKVRMSAIKCYKHMMYRKSDERIRACCECLEEATSDSNPNVQRAVLEVTSYWLQTLPYRYDVFDRILPSMLMLLHYESDICDEAKEAWKIVGKQYLKENQEMFKDYIDYAPVELDHYPQTFIRPELGCRVLVQREIGRMMYHVTTALLDWREETRISMARCLTMLVLHAEAYILQHLRKLLVALCKVLTQSQETVCKHVIEAAEIMGYFVPVSACCSLMVPEMKEAATVSHYRLFAALLSNSAKKEVLKNLDEIVETFAADSMHITQETIPRQALLRVLSVLISCISYEENASEIREATFYSIYSLLLVLKECPDELAQLQADDLIEKLSKCSLLFSSNILNEKYLTPLLDRSVDVAKWNEYSAPFCTFCSILPKHFADLVNLNFERFTKVLSSILSSDSKELIHKTLLKLTEVTRNSETMEKIENTDSLLIAFVTGPLKSVLIWKPGRTAEILRWSVLVLVRELIASAKFESPHVLQKILPLIVGCVEDSNAMVRLSCLTCIIDALKSYKRKHVIGTDIVTKYISMFLGRLEDKEDSVRMLALSVIRILLTPDISLTLKKETDELVSEIYTSLVIYINDDDEQFRRDLIDLLKSVSYMNPELLLNSLRSADSNDKDAVSDLTFHVERQLGIH